MANWTHHLAAGSFCRKKMNPRLTSRWTLRETENWERRFQETAMTKTGSKKTFRRFFFPNDFFSTEKFTRRPRARRREKVDATGAGTLELNVKNFRSTRSGTNLRSRQLRWRWLILRHSCDQHDAWCEGLWLAVHDAVWFDGFLLVVVAWLRPIMVIFWLIMTNHAQWLIGNNKSQ